jgi:hypothetical protein
LQLRSRGRPSATLLGSWELSRRKSPPPMDADWLASIRCGCWWSYRFIQPAGGLQTLSGGEPNVGGAISSARFRSSFRDQTSGRFRLQRAVFYRHPGAVSNPIQAKKPRRDCRGRPDRYGKTRDLSARSPRKEIELSATSQLRQRLRPTLKSRGRG